jgi:branched-chain amino acid transport system permease protein
MLLRSRFKTDHVPSETISGRGQGAADVSEATAATAADLDWRSRLAALPPGALALRIAVAVVVVFVAAWVSYKAFGDPRQFVIVGLNGLTLAGLYFVVASGFTLIFGLMRVVNMAHGSLYMLAGFFALELQTKLTGGEATSAFGSSQAGLGDWIIPLVVACLAVGGIGLVMQQVFLRWNQGQDLRQALITIAISIIIADQALAHFGGIAESLAAPDSFPESVHLPFSDLTYPFFRIFVLLVAIAVGLGLWAMIQRTRFGMIVRAGVDDRQMVSALGINIQLVFAGAFFLGALLAGLGGVLGGTMISVDKANDTQYLLISLIVVIIGGMGSLAGAALGALALGLVDSFGDVYLPAGYTNYSILLIFGLLVLVLAVRPLGLFGRPA